MTDLISRADAIDAVWKLDKDANEYVVDDAKEIHGYCTAIGVCVGELSALPSADAVSREAHYDAVANRITDMEERGFVSVVRCKDCRWQEECSQFVVLHKFCGVYQEISFCSHGERREP